jgi:hypothetical protein
MPDEYLRLEAESSVKHKYMDGQVLAIAAGDRWGWHHNA